jgi:hypothetical protein
LDYQSIFHILWCLITFTFILILRYYFEIDYCLDSIDFVVVEGINFLDLNLIILSPLNF